MLLGAKNPRNRSRCMCSCFMKKSRFFDNLSALQFSLLCDPHCTVHMDFLKKIGPMKRNSLYRRKIGGEAPGMTQTQNDLISPHFYGIKCHLPAREEDPFQLTCPSVNCQCTVQYFRRSVFKTPKRSST